MKTKLKIALASTVISVGAAFGAFEQNADDAKTRMDNISKMMKEVGITAFSLFNGTGEEAGLSKHKTTTEALNYATALKSNDPDAFVICVQDGKYVVNTADQSKIGKDALNGPDAWTDAKGNNLATKCISAQRNANGYPTVDYALKVNGVQDSNGQPLMEERRLLVAHSQDLLGKKNTTGTKFFCATSFTLQNAKKSSSF